MIGEMSSNVGKRLAPDRARRARALGVKSQIRNPKSQKTSKIQIPKLKLVFIILLRVICAQGIALGAATNEGDDLKLRPPRGEMPPPFWEQNDRWIVPVALAALLALALLVWYFTRPKPVAGIPPEVRARQELEALAAKSADRELLSRTSQVLKAYLAEVFGLPREELTTAEFCKAFSARTDPGESLSRNVCEFLRRGDQMKFAPGPPPASTIPEALKLLDQAEARRADLRAARANTRNAPAVPQVAKS
jgi:hypothetical protein